MRHSTARRSASPGVDVAIQTYTYKARLTTRGNVHIGTGTNGVPKAVLGLFLGRRGILNIIFWDYGARIKLESQTFCIM